MLSDFSLKCRRQLSCWLLRCSIQSFFNVSPTFKRYFNMHISFKENHFKMLDAINKLPFQALASPSSPPWFLTDGPFYQSARQRQKRQIANLLSDLSHQGLCWLLQKTVCLNRGKSLNLLSFPNHLTQSILFSNRIILFPEKEENGRGNKRERKRWGKIL